MDILFPNSLYPSGFRTHWQALPVSCYIDGGKIVDIPIPPFLRKNLFPLTFLLTHRLSRGFFLFCCFLNIIHYLYSFDRLSSVVSRSSFKLAPISLPHSSLSIFFLSGAVRCSSLIQYFPCPKPGSCNGQWHLEVVTDSLPFQWTKPGHLCYFLCGFGLRNQTELSFFSLLLS